MGSFWISRQVLLYIFIIALVSIVVFYFAAINSPKLEKPVYVRLNHNLNGKEKHLQFASNVINYAYAQASWQSSIGGNHGKVGPFFAVDGTKTYSAVTKDEDNPWWQINLSKSLSINTVRIFSSSSPPGDCLVMISHKPLPNDLSSSLKSAEISTTFACNETFVWNLRKPITGEFLKIQKKGKGSLKIQEVEVFDKQVPEMWDGTKNIEYQLVEREGDVSLAPPDFYSMLDHAKKTLNMENPQRAFTIYGKEIFASEYVPYLSSVEKSEPLELWISEGENYIGDISTALIFLNTGGAGYNTNLDYLGELIESLHILSMNVFRFYYFPIIVFHSWNEQEENNKKIFADKFPYLSIRFVSVSQYFPPHLPTEIDPSVNMSDYRKGSTCAPENKWKLNYLHMGRFFSVKLWTEQILKEYDYVWRLDTDATIDRPMQKHFVREMHSKKKIFGYYHRGADVIGCVLGLEEANENFAKRKDLKFKHKEKVQKQTVYWGGFGVYATRFFTSDLWLEYGRFLDTLGGFYNHRWGEQDVLPGALSLFIDFKELFWVSPNSIHVYHDHVEHRASPGVSTDDLKYLTN